jgi:hypothetical protein
VCPGSLSTQCIDFRVSHKESPHMEEVGAVVASAEMFLG